MTCILRISYVCISEVVVEEIHVNIFVCAFYGNRLPNIAQRLSQIFRFDAIGKYPLAFIVTMQHFAAGIGYLITQSRDVLPRAVVQFAINQATIARSGKSLTKPFARIEHQQLCIIIRLHVIRPERILVALILLQSILVRESQTLIERDTRRRNRRTEYFLDIGGALQIVIMVGYDDAILAALQIRLQIVGSHLASPSPGTLGFLRCPIGRATMSNHGIQGYIVANRSHLLTDGPDIYFHRIVIVVRASLQAKNNRQQPHLHQCPPRTQTYLRNLIAIGKSHKAYFDKHY